MPNLLLAAAAIASATFVSPEVGHFPGAFFDRVAKPSLQRRAMEKWPGPAQLVGLWQTAELDEGERAAVLLGASASHDPVLLGLYREAITDTDPQLRMAAAYGYRDLLGDGLPNLAGGVDQASGQRLAAEIDAVRDTLRARPLVEFWLQAVLMNEGTSMPGWEGAVLQRSPGVCFKALDKIVQFDDFQLLATAYRIARDRATRVNLVLLLEAVTLQKFLIVPTDGTTGWGHKEVDAALDATDAFLATWLDQRCPTDPEHVLSASLAGLGVRGVDPFSADAWEVWLQLLRRGTPPWRMMAARQLYNLGGRWSQLSVVGADSENQVKEFDELILWYRLVPAHAASRQRP